MYLAHVFPSYSRTNTERALRGSGIAFPPVNGRLLDRNIDRLMESGYLPGPSASARCPAPMPTSRYPDWESFEFPAATAPTHAGVMPRRADAPVAFCADLSPASVLGAYRRGIIPLPAPDEYFRTLNEVRYEDQVAAGAIAVVGDERGRPLLGGLVVARPAAGDRRGRRAPRPQRQEAAAPRRAHAPPPTPRSARSPRRAARAGSRAG